MSTESIATPPQSPATSGEACSACGSPLAGDQRYCLQCGERRPGVSAFLQGDAPAAAPGPPVPPQPLRAVPADGGSRNQTLNLIAGVGVLLLAMGVGVLIGRSSSSHSAAPAQVITVGSSLPGAGSTPQAAFASDWPSGTSGYTIQLQTLPDTASVSEVDSAKTAAGSKGAAGVGALKAEEFSSLTGGGYVIYAGRYTKAREAHKALGSLKKSFPAAKVIHVADGAGASSSPSSSSSRSGGDGSSIEHPAPPSVLEGKGGTGGGHESGKSYVEKSKNLPDVVETG